MSAPTRSVNKHTAVAARYSTTAQPAIVSGTVLNWATKDYDTHNAVTTGAACKFTAPFTGKYLIDVHFATNGATVGTVSDVIGFDYFINGGSTVNLVYVSTPITGTYVKRAQGCAIIQLNAGDFVQTSGTNNSGQAHSLNTSATSNYIEIIKID